MIKSQELKKYHLPDGPGVYFFKKKKNILYVGKATSIKDRVKSYFSSDLIQTRGPLIVDLIFQADKIDFIEGAKKAGWQTVWFDMNNKEKAISEIEKILGV